MQHDTQQIAWLTLDRQGRDVNTLSADVMEELSSVLDRLDSQPPAGLVIRSGKPTAFIAGADMDEFGTLDSVEAVKALLRRGWTLFERLANLSYPTLALINGHCLGGGLELALACRYRLLVDNPETRLGLPEVMLGIFPGWGGIKRLPERIGVPAALDMMLTGRRLTVKRALALELADARVPLRVAQAAAKQWVVSGRPPRYKRGWQTWIALKPWKSIVLWRATRQLDRKDPLHHYPAPRAILALWSEHQGNALKATALLRHLLSSKTALNLLRVYRLQERLKGLGRVQNDHTATHVHVVGAGVMGGDIAIWCALHGLRVTLQDQTPQAIAPVLARASQLFQRRLKEARLVQAACDRLIADCQGYGVAQADVVIEAISENVQAKQDLYAKLEPLLRNDALLATNTSSLSLESLRTGLQRPERLIGVHFFNPVAQMPLVEVVYTKDENAQHAACMSRACAFVGQIGKLPLPVHSAPGFFVNAVLTPYLLAAMHCVDQGVDAAGLDEAMVAYGMPMGPIELIDTVGLDVAFAVGQQIVPGATLPICLQHRTAQKHLGRKTGQGFYRWQDGKAYKPRVKPVTQSEAVKLVQILIEGARRQVEANVVADSDLADAGMIFGTGYAPFTGGPLHQEQA